MGPEIDRKLAAILSADVVGYSRLMAEDEAATIRTLTDYREEIAMRVRQHRGRVVDTPGDNLLAEFPTALDAVRCAIESQAVLRALNATLPDERQMDFRIGVHMGDVSVEGERIYGDGVNIAARLEGLAEAGGVCISATVHEQVRNKVDVGFTDLGDQTVKNIPDQVRVYRVQPWAQAEGPARASAPPGQRPQRLPTALIAAAAGLLVLGVGLWASWPRPLGVLIDLAGVSGPPVDPPLPDKPSLVVLPFENVSGDPEQEYFSDGITEDLTNEFARNPFLFVISRNSAFTYKGKRVKVEDVGRELGVRYVIEGSVRKAGDRVRITAQLIDATTGGHLWSEQYDRDLSDIFTVQSEIAEEILGAVGKKVMAAESQRLARKRPQNLTAAEASWRGVTHLARFTREDTEKARLLFERAIEVDPGYAPSYAFLGNTYVIRFANGWSRDPALLDRAEELGRRAIEIDSSWPAGHLTLAFVNLLRGNLAEAVAGADRAIERAPSVEWPHALRGLALAQQGRMLEATRSIRRALRINPRAPTSLLVSVGFVNLAAGRREDAIDLMEQVRSANRDNLTARVVLAVFYEQEGRHGEASTVVREIQRVRPDLTAAEATEIIPGLERITSAEEFAQFPEHLRSAGLP
jgi:adenylate cyclase